MGMVFTKMSFYIVKTPAKKLKNSWQYKNKTFGAAKLQAPLFSPLIRSSIGNSTVTPQAEMNKENLTNFMPLLHFYIT